MSDLQLRLFLETYAQRKAYERARETWGEWDHLTYYAHARFCALYELIEFAGLEDKYQAWREKEEAAERSERDDERGDR